ncbi:MAG: carbohydrate kinase family protein [Candidatus Woesearchaeota archaeon]
MSKIKSISDLSVLVIGTTCTDMINPGFDFLDEIKEDGLVVDSGRFKPVHPKWLAYDQGKGTNAMGGGSLNVAPLLAKSGRRTGIMTALGKKSNFGKKYYDRHGEFMLNIMQQTGVVPIIVDNYRYPSGASFIRPERSGRNPILHCPNAVDHLDIEKPEILERIEQTPEGSFIHYLYSGLMAKMDEENGRKLARVVERLSKKYHVMVDTHTFVPNVDEVIAQGLGIPRYNLLKPVLPHLSVFFCSAAEARMISNTFGMKVDADFEDEWNMYFLTRLSDHFTRPGKPQIYGITAGTDAFILYRKPNGDKVGPIKVESEYVISDASEFVGAGDSFRAGFELEFTRPDRTYSDPFKVGELEEHNLSQLCRMGHLMAACYVTRRPDSQYGNIPRYEKMIDLLNRGLSFIDKTELLRELDVIR